MAAFIVTPYVTNNERKLWLALLKVSALHFDVRVHMYNNYAFQTLPLRV